MKKQKRRQFILILFVLLIVGFLCALPFRRETITTVLKTKSYDYLPREAKDYIEKVYEETGEIVPTEKNKKENEPYLNPQYVNYLALSEEEKKQVGNIPLVYAIDYDVEEVVGAYYPSTYDLRNINGNSYVTPQKNQSTLNLCWDFTMLEQAESYLMLKNNAPYSGSSKVFSTRQLDYASSKDGILSYTNDVGTRSINDGGNFLTSTIVMMNGLTFTNESSMPFNLSKEQKELVSVLNYGNAQYELNSSVFLSALSENATQSEATAYRNKIKEFVMQNGGAYVGTQGPGYSCSSTNSDGTTILRVDDSCVQDAGHAMQVIGWNDNYSYAYCKTGSSHSNNISTCSSSNLVQGTGAWILRNSWGNSYPIVYLAFDSKGDDFYSITNLTAKTDWDNNYHKNMSATVIYYGNKDTQTFEKKINTPEKVEKIKFFTYGKGGSYRVSFYTDSQNYLNVKTVSAEYPGIVTLDLSDNNILLNDSSFRVYIESTNSVPVVSESMSIFTSNVSETPVIQSPTKSYQFDVSDSNYSFRHYSYTKNIASNQNLTYTLYNKSNTNVSSYLTVQNKGVAHNDVNAIVTISSTIPSGLYTLKLTYGSASEDISVRIGDLEKYTVRFNYNDGSGGYTTRTVESGGSINITDLAVSKEGYTFTGWNTKANGTGQSYPAYGTIDNITSNLVLYAQLSPITYIISFNANGGEGIMSDQFVIYDTSTTLKPNTYTKEGYHFKSWNTRSNGKGISYQDGATIQNLANTQDLTVYLYAIWEEDVPFTIDHYSVDLNKRIIDLIEVNTTKEQYQSYFHLAEGYTLDIELAQNGKLYTGSKTKILQNDVEKYQFTNIVRGDINGDGKLSSMDYVRIKNHIMNQVVITDEILKTAADANNDNKISALDYITIKNHIMNGG